MNGDTENAKRNACRILGHEGDLQGISGCVAIGLDKDDEDREDGRNRMTTPRAALHVASESAGATGGKAHDLAHDQDPLRRLEAELRDVGSERPDVERLYGQAWALLEEAWGLVTECLVMRDGLLDACREIEQTMEAVQLRLAALPAGFESSDSPSNRAQSPVAVERDALNGPNGAAAL